MPINPLSPAPNTIVTDPSNEMLLNAWNLFYFNIFDTVNSLVYVSEQNNLLLNGNFNSNSAGVTFLDQNSVDNTVADGWRIAADPSASYSSTYQDYSLSEVNGGNSSSYIDLNINNSGSNPIYLTQTLPGLQHVRSVSGKSIAFSGEFYQFVRQ